ncbi:hypothetical protein MMC25_006475 [Agyrium rufum]|nr:hypothetical protein [Agyrium rufum]
MSRQHGHQGDFSAGPSSGPSHGTSTGLPAYNPPNGPDPYNTIKYYGGSTSSSGTNFLVQRTEFSIDRAFKVDHLKVKQMFPGQAEFDLLVYAADIALSAMAVRRSQEILIDLAKRIVSVSTSKAEDLVMLFMCKITTVFPAMWCTGNMPLSTHGYMIRREDRSVLARGHDAFNPRDHTVHINGYRVGAMIQAARQPRWFRNYLSHTTYCILHEVAGHMFVTFLNGRRGVTPVDLRHPLPWTKAGPNQGESGEYFEYKFFGGMVQWIKDPKSDIWHPGVPKLLRTDGMVATIPEDIVDRFLNRDFVLPLPTQGDWIPYTQGPSRNTIENQAAMMKVLVQQLDVPQYNLDSRGHNVPRERFTLPVENFCVDPRLLQIPPPS